MKIKKNILKIYLQEVVLVRIKKNILKIYLQEVVLAKIKCLIIFKITTFLVISNLNY